METAIPTEWQITGFGGSLQNEEEPGHKQSIREDILGKREGSRAGLPWLEILTPSLGSLTN